MNERHFEAIRKRVAMTRFSRRIHDPDEIVNDVFLRLSKRGELPTGKAVSARKVDAVIRAVLRKYRNAEKRHADIDEIGHDDHPSYTMAEYCREEVAHRMFQEFCLSQPAPKSVIYRLCLTQPNRSIARSLGMDERTVAGIADGMPREYKNYVLKKYPEKICSLAWS